MSLVKAACMTAFSWLLADEDSSSRAVESGRHGLRTKLLDGTERETHETARRLTTLSILVESHASFTSEKVSSETVSSERHRRTRTEPGHFHKQPFSCEKVSSEPRKPELVPARVLSVVEIYCAR